MANFVGELLFAIFRSLMRDWVDSFIKRACQRLDARLDRNSRFARCAALLIGFLLVLAAHLYLD